MSDQIRPRNRILYVLHLFDRQPVWSVEEIAKEMGTSTSSAYHDVQGLCRMGFMEPVVGRGYVLGPAFIHFDRLLRQSDPLVRVAAPTMRELLAATTQRAVAVLSRRYRDCVMCVHQESGDEPHPIATYERGVAMPLFRGATSKAILAHLPERTLRRVYLENEEHIRASLGCANWREFRAELEGIRSAGVAITVSEVAAGRVGIAAPIFVGSQVIAGLSLVLDESDYTGARQRARYPQALVATARRLSEAIANEDIWIARG